LVDRYGKRPNIPELADISLASFSAWFERIRQNKLAPDEIDDDPIGEPELQDTSTASLLLDCTTALKRVGYKRCNRENVICFVNYKEKKDPEAFCKKQILLIYPWHFPGATNLPSSSSCLESKVILAGSEDFKSRYEIFKESILKERALFYKNMHVDYDNLEAELRDVDLTYEL
jgi:hypothetical protein